MVWRHRRAVVAGKTTWAELHGRGLVLPARVRGAVGRGAMWPVTSREPKYALFAATGRAGLRDRIGGLLMMLGGLGAGDGGLGMMPGGIRRLAGRWGRRRGGSGARWWVPACRARGLAAVGCQADAVEGPRQVILLAMD